jgi:hypothetical protein
MSNIKVLKAIISSLETGLDLYGIDEVGRYTAGLYGEDGHVGDDDEDVTGMMWIEEEDTGRTWNIRVQLDS